MADRGRRRRAPEPIYGRGGCEEEWKTHKITDHLHSMYYVVDFERTSARYFYGSAAVPDLYTVTIYLYRSDEPIIGIPPFSDGRFYDVET